jgi:hypothetical protein
MESCRRQSPRTSQSGDAKAREWLSEYLLPKPADTLPLSRMAAAELFDVDLAEFDALKVFQAIQSAEGYIQMIENFRAAEKAGVLDSKSKTPLTDMLKIGIFGVDALGGSKADA